MQKYTEIQTVRISKEQKETLRKLRIKYKINPQKFIREAIKEKLEKDYDSITIKPKKIKVPF